MLKDMLRGTANAQMGILLNQMQSGGLNCGRRVVEYASGVKITCVVNYRDRHFDIVVPENLGGENIREEYVVGFICHPATDGLYDQVQPEVKDRKDNKVIWYDDKALKWFSQDYVMKITTTDLFGNIISAQDIGNEYGNVDWKGPEQPNDPTQRTRRILTWKGPPSRYWPLDIFAEVDGVTVVDHMIEGVLQDTWYYTPFSGNVYEHGLVAYTMPNLYFPMGNNNNLAAQVLGAAYREVDGKLVVVVKTCYNQYPRYKAPQEMMSTWQVRYQGMFYQEWLDNKNGADEQALSLGAGYTVAEVPDPGRGYWIEVLLKEPGASLPGWNRLLRVSTDSNPAITNWFFSEDGTQAVTVWGGWLHKIVLVQGVGSVTTCMHTTESAGKFENTIVTNTVNNSTNWVSDYLKAHPPVILPSGGGGTGPTAESFYAYYPHDAAYARTVAPFIDKYGRIQDYTTTYADTKSGKIVIAADYQKNELVTLDANLAGSQNVSLRNRSTQQHKGRAAWLRSTANWTTLSEQVAPCAVNRPYQSGNLNYNFHQYYAAGKRLEINVCVSEIPLNIKLVTQGSFRDFYGATTINCAEGCSENYVPVVTMIGTGLWTRSPYTDPDAYFDFGGFYATMTQFDLNDTMEGVATEGDWWFDGDRRYYVWGAGYPCASGGVCGRPVIRYSTFVPAVRICSNWLSDSYMSNVVDYKGDVVVFPEQVDGYILKVYAVRDQSCSV
jgi:hypothetical protein